MAHASESGHWYARDGSPVYEVKRADGKGMRAATLADARKLGLLPGVSGIIRCAAAPGLERWKQEQMLLAALTLPRNADEPEGAWLDRVRSDSGEQARKAAERGTRIHAAIQGHYEGQPPEPDAWPFVVAVKQAIVEAFGEQQWHPERSYAHRLGFGSKLDLHCSAIILDFKTKEFTAADAKQLAWDEQCIQLAAYRHLIGRPDAAAANVFVSATVPGLVRIHHWTHDELNRGWCMFQALLAYWKAKNKIETAWELEAA
jgi:hypothetical protein